MYDNIRHVDKVNVCYGVWLKLTEAIATAPIKHSGVINKIKHI